MTRTPVLAVLALLAPFAAATAPATAAPAAVPAAVPAAAPAAAPAPGLAHYRPVAETPAVFDDAAGGDADADDPAIYVAPGRPGRSVILGTVKNAGLEAYDLDATRLQHVSAPPPPAEGLEASRFNNVDVLPVTRWGPLAVVSDRGRDRLRAYRIDPRGAAASDHVLTDVTSPAAPRIFSATEAEVEDQATGYGLATRQRGATSYAVVSQRNRTDLAMERLDPAAGGTVGYTRTATLTLPSTFGLSDGSTWSPCEDPGDGPQVEGMVVDGVRDVLYAAQEDVGVWRIPLAGAGFGTPELVERVREFGRASTYDPATEECTVSDVASPDSGQHLSADAEGLTLVSRLGVPVGFVASSQGDDTFATYDLAGRYQGGFDVVDAGGVDSVQQCDGAALTTTPLGRRFPRGLLVVQDGDNTPDVVDADGEVRAGSSFKLVPWGQR